MRSLGLLLISLIVLGCASLEKKRVEEEASKSNVTDAQALGNRIEDLIDGSQNLSAEQKSRLHQIIAVNKKTAMDLGEESYKYRSVLIKELLAGSLNQTQVDLLKAKIRDVELAKLKNTFDTAERISMTVSDTPENRKIGEQILLLEKGVLSQSNDR